MAPAASVVTASRSVVGPVACPSGSTMPGRCADSASATWRGDGQPSSGPAGIRMAIA